MADIKWMDLKEFRDFGYLGELNRQWLHPLGLALVFGQSEDDEIVILGIRDERDDPEGMTFASGFLDKDKTLRVGFEQAKRYAIRREKLGYVIQPVEDK